MPVQLLRRSARERRRILLAMGLCAIGAVVSGAPAALPVWVFVPLAGLAAGALALAFPRLRSFAEAGALAWLGLALLMRALPHSVLDPAVGGGPLAAFATWTVLLALARGLRQVLLRLPGPVLTGPCFKLRAGSWVDIHRLWYGLVPTPGMGPRYGDPDCVAIEDVDTTPGRMRLVTRTRHQNARITGLQILEADPPFHIRLSAREETPQGVIPAGVSEIFFVDLGDRRLVLFSHTFPRMALGTALLAWLDDAPGRLLDRRLATIERRATAEGAALGAPLPGLGDPTQAAFAEWQMDAAQDTAESAASQNRAAHPRGTRRWRQAS